MSVLPVILIALFVVSGLLALLYQAAELQTTIAFVLDKGGLWLRYSTGLGRLRLTGYQVRLSPGHAPRAWRRVLLLNKYKPADFGKVYHSTTNREWKLIQTPLRSAFDIGIKLIIRELDVKARIGVENNAAATALLCGCIFTLLQSVRSASTRGRFMPRGFVVVRPVFSHARLSVRFKCILAVKVRHIIREVLDNRTRRNSDGQSSDREHHANDDGKPSQHGGRKYDRRRHRGDGRRHGHHPDIQG